jgi:hypothetical protein
MDKDLLLITIYCMVDEFTHQAQITRILQRSGRHPKLSDEAILTLGLFQEYTGVHDEDDYWKYICKNFRSYFPGQLVDLSQYHRRKKNLNPLINLFRLQQIALLPPTPDQHIIDCVGSSVINVTKYFDSESFEEAGIGHCASKRLNSTYAKTQTCVKY